MSEKKCTKCGEVKAFGEFGKNKKGRFGLQSACRKCSNKIAQLRKDSNIAFNSSSSYKIPADKKCSKCKITKEGNDFSFDLSRYDGLCPQCKECVSKKGKEWYQENKEYKDNQNKAWTEANKEKSIQIQKDWYQKNRGVVIKRQIAYAKKRRQKHTGVRVVDNLRRRVNNAIQGGAKSASTLDLLGCDVEYVRQHLETQFSEGMGWNNYGLHGWHVDHIIPCASFDLTDPEQQKECFHYTNLQPLWAEDNLKKSDTVPTEHQVTLL